MKGVVKISRGKDFFEEVLNRFIEKMLQVSEYNIEYFRVSRVWKEYLRAGSIAEFDLSGFSAKDLQTFAEYARMYVSMEAINDGEENHGNLLHEVVSALDSQFLLQRLQKPREPVDYF